MYSKKPNRYKKTVITLDIIAIKEKEECFTLISI